VRPTPSPGTGSRVLPTVAGTSSAAYDMRPMKTALITGVTGQDGGYLAEQLVGRGYRVVGVSRAARPGLDIRGTVELRTVDLEDPAAVRALLAEVAPDELFHLGGQSSVGLSFEDPAGTYRSVVLTTLNLLEAARGAKARPRLFIAGSGEVFGDTGTTRADETTPFAPRSPYALAKGAAVELARTYRKLYGVFASVGFLYNHESPRRPEKFVTRKIVRGACEIAAGRATTLELGDLGVVRDWGYAPEYVDAMWRVLQGEAPDDFVIATGQSHPLATFVELVFRRLGLAPEGHVVSNPKLHRPSEVRALHADPSRAERVLGWKAQTMLEGLAAAMVDAELRAAKSAG
jgi:GDPmannose 4,6-dehydratase